MNRKTLGGHLTLNGYVRSKIRRMTREGLDFRSLFELMFSERDNIMFEGSRGERTETATYGEVRASVLKKAAWLRSRFGELPRQSVIGLYMENSREWIETFWAILLSGFCPLLMNLRLDRGNLEKALANAEARAVIAAGPASFPVPVLPAGWIGKAGEARAESAELPEPGENILLMSSGTSEHVKICAYSAEAFRIMIGDSWQIVRQCPQIKKHAGGQLKLLTFLPFYHIFGLVAVYVWFAFFSRTFVLLENMSPQTLIRTIRQHRVTHIFAVPLLWNRVYEQAMETIAGRGPETVKRFEKGMRIAERTGDIPGIGALIRRVLFREIRENLFGSDIRFLISGGSEIRPEVLRFFNSVGYHLANGYGMTEIGITSVELSRKPSVLCSGSVGKPFASAEYRRGADGVLEVRSPAMACRIHSGDGWKPAGKDWFRTGDLAEERDGRWYILGRSDDLVISPTGENLNPNLVEAALATEGIAELCLIGVRSEDGVQPVLLARPDSSVTGSGIQELRERLTGRIREAGLEGQILSVALISEPLMEEREIKLNRSRVARRFREGQLTLLSGDGDGAEEHSALKEAVRAMFAEAAGKSPEEIGDRTDFFLECGATSLDYFSLAAQVQETWGVSLPMTEHPYTTVLSLTNYLRKQTAEEGSGGASPEVSGRRPEDPAGKGPEDRAEQAGDA